MLSDTQIDEIVSLRRDDRLSLAAIGKRFTPPLSAERVRQILKQRGLDNTRIEVEPVITKRERRTYDWDEIEYWHKKPPHGLGMSSYDIAERLRTHASYIRQGLTNRQALRSRDEAAALKREQQAS